LKLNIIPRTFHFRQPAGTSRGVYTLRKSWMLELTDASSSCKGIGECAPLPALSQEDSPHYEDTLREICRHFERLDGTPQERLDRMTNLLRPYPSMLFGLETAVLHFVRGSIRLFDTPFSRGEESIPINGLVWMGNRDEMYRRMEEKLAKGFHCIKFKIGAIDFDSEIALIRDIRQRFGPQDIEIRTDANGAFSEADALWKLDELARYDIHSIEQPIRQHQWEAMARIAAASPIPVALDEDLIGVNSPAMKAELLDTVRPAYIILKPSLHGGMAGTREWIALARQRNIGSWITSALESNVGLSAVAQLAADVYGPGIQMPQGLGTGQLFTDNIPMPVLLEGSELWMR